MRIVPYQEKYKAGVQVICLETSYAKGKPREEAFVLSMYCNGYLRRGLAYVLVDDAEEAQGYILCAPNYERYRQQLKESMENMDFFHKLAAKVEAVSYASFSAEYPAHLHIDIRESFTGQGSGTMLMTTLLEDLKSKGVPGIMLQVGAKNKRAVAFYKKQGFQILKTGMFGYTMGREI